MWTFPWLSPTMAVCVSDAEPPSTICWGSVITTVFASAKSLATTIPERAESSIIVTRLIDLNV